MRCYYFGHGFCDFPGKDPGLCDAKDETKCPNYKPEGKEASDGE